MRKEDLPQRWKQKLQDYLTEKYGSNSAHLSAYDFTSDTTVKIIFEDDSKIEFNYAFFLKSPESKEVAVFTEHCGYHIFPLYDGLDITTQER